MKRYEVIGVEGLPEIGRGDDLAGFIHETARRQQTPLESRDILVVSQKIVSKTEGRLVRLSEVTPSARAQALALGESDEAPLGLGDDLLAHTRMSRDSSGVCCRRAGLRE